MEQRYLTPEQLETKYGRARKASIMPDAKPNKAGREVEADGVSVAAR